jgi:rare lipoprotein A
MDGTWNLKRRYGVRLAILSALLATPAQAIAPADGAAALSGEAAFAASFADLAALPQPPDPATDPALDAVDLDHFEPPVAEPAIRHLGSGNASFYGKRFHGRRTASGAPFDMHAMTAAHRTLPFGSKVRVTNPSNGEAVVVTINDRGPFHGNRVIDLSRAAASELGLIQRGHGKVELELLEG